MVTCPNCGSDVRAPARILPIPCNTAQKKERQDSIGIFECPNCRVRFRHAVPMPEKAASIKNMVERINVIKGGLMHTLMNLHEKIDTLETERVGLMVEIANLRKVAESRAEALENEVSKLRSEVESLRELLGYKERQETRD